MKNTAIQFSPNPNIAKQQVAEYEAGFNYIKYLPLEDAYKCLIKIIKEKRSPFFYLGIIGGIQEKEGWHDFVEFSHDYVKDWNPEDNE